MRYAIPQRMSIMGDLPKEVDGCAALAVEWVSGVRPPGEFKDISEAKPGDVLFFAHWERKRFCVGIFLDDERMATRAELQSTKVSMIRTGRMLREGWEFVGGVHLGR